MSKLTTAANAIFLQFSGVIWVVLWCAVGIVYFAAIGRNKLILSPEEEFALAHKA